MNIYLYKLINETASQRSIHNWEKFDYEIYESLLFHYTFVLPRCSNLVIRKCFVRDTYVNECTCTESGTIPKENEFSASA